MTVPDHMFKQSRKLRKELYRSLTRNRRCEMVGRKTFILAIYIDVFLCNPHIP